MNFEPQTLYIGVIDFFSVLLPGALLTYFVKDDLGSRLLREKYSRLAGAEGLAVFIVSSYLLGHFIFLVGSWLLDGYVYDPIRKATDDEQIKRLAKGRRLSWRFTRALSKFLIKRDADSAHREAVHIMENQLGSFEKASINAFQWCKAKLTLEHPAAIATVQRFEADSKFFRSLFVVLCILIPISLTEGRLAVAGLAVPLLVLAFWRYAEQRLKATSQAYWYVIALEGNSDRAISRTPQHRDDGLSHVGGVVFRRQAEKHECLLVQTSDGRDMWVLPKGHLRARELPEECAVREVREETGTWAMIVQKLRNVSFQVDSKNVNVMYFVMDTLEEGRGSEKRLHRWLSLEAAIAQVAHSESVEVLQEVARTYGVSHLREQPFEQ